MSDQQLLRSVAAPARPGGFSRLPLGRHLVRIGAVTSEQLVLALQMQMHLRLDAPIGEILVAEGWAKPDEITRALADQHGLSMADLAACPPDPALLPGPAPEFWLRHQAIPWRRIGPVLQIAVARPDRFAAIAADFGETDLALMPVIAERRSIEAAIAARFAAPLALRAETRVDDRLSFRRPWPAARAAGLAALVGALLLLWLFPVATCTTLFGFAVLTLVLYSALKLAATVAHLLTHSHLTAPGTEKPAAGPARGRLPKISMLVPLYKERESVAALVRRLSRLSYPKVLLDVVLVLEAQDMVTRRSLGAIDLPAWMRVIEVPPGGGLTTKPRAMNYALDFCEGEILGVWDAEDAPAPDQLEQVAAAFADLPDDVVCLQGILDYYNPRSSWRARCFTIEYASWFRVVLPGISRLRLAVPLGGTTFFMRRRALDALGGWDAHNVTEDADLGMRISRAGFRTGVIDTVTHEEANFRAWPWIRQRSRWLKGFMATYLVHMRSPLRLLRDLGPARFAAFQAFFLGTLGQFLLAPVLWTFWVGAIGFAHPLAGLLPPAALTACVGLFVFAEALTMSVGLIAVSGPGRRFLLPWVPTMILYFPLGVIAAYKALYELLSDPYYWDKTQHGHAAEEAHIA